MMQIVKTEAQTPVSDTTENPHNFVEACNHLYSLMWCKVDPIWRGMEGRGLNDRYGSPIYLMSFVIWKIFQSAFEL